MFKRKVRSLSLLLPHLRVACRPESSGGNSLYVCYRPSVSSGGAIAALQKAAW
jgi:hypothetical protein